MQVTQQSALRLEFGRLLTNEIPHFNKRVIAKDDFDFTFDRQENSAWTYPAISPLAIPRILGYPFLIFGSSLLRHIQIRGHSDIMTSWNMSSEHTLYFPCEVNEFNVRTLNIPFLPLQKNIDLSYFDKLQDILVYLKNYNGLLFVEADVSELFTNGYGNGYAWKLAYTYISLLTKVPNLPKYVVIVGATPRLPKNFEGDNGIGISCFNGYLKYLAYHYAIGFVDPAEVFLSHRRYKQGRYNAFVNKTVPVYTSQCVTPPNFPKGAFTRNGDLTQRGLVLFSNYISVIASMTREIATKLAMSIRSDILK